MRRLSPAHVLAVLGRGAERLRRPPRPGGPLPVGTTCLQLGGVTAQLWYPAAAASREAPQGYLDVFRGRAAADAALAEMPGRWPLLLISHGLAGSRFDLCWLAEALAAHGCAALAVDHPHSGQMDFVRARAGRLWERALCLSAAADALLQQPRFAGRLDGDRMVALGHSAGGSTALMLGGARLAPARFAQLYPQASAVDIATPCHDRRVRCAIGLAPGTGVAFEPAGLAACTVPALLVSGTADDETPEALCAAHYARHLPHATWHSIAGAGHFVFKPRCLPYGMVRGRGICVDPPGIDRAAVHRQVVHWSLAHLRAHGLLGAAAPPG